MTFKQSANLLANNFKITINEDGFSGSINDVKEQLAIKKAESSIFSSLLLTIFIFGALLLAVFAFLSIILCYYHKKFVRF